MSSATLSHRVIRGVVWFAALNLTSRALGIARVVVLARLLTPEDFGMIAIALVATVFLEAVSATGTHLALIQRRDNPGRLLDTAWTVGVVRHLVIAVSLVVIAPYLGDFFRVPDAVPVVRAMAVAPLLHGFTNIAVVLLRREMTFRPYYILQVSGVAADLGVSVVLALWLGTVWALVGGAIALAAARVVVSYVVHPYRPRVRLDVSALRELYRYGRWVSLSAVLDWAITDAIQAVVAYLLSVRVLGFYRVAWRFASIPVGHIAEPVAGVTVSAYAKLQDVPDRVRHAYVRVLGGSAVLFWPISVAIALHADALVSVLLGPRWIETVPFVRLLAIAGLARSIGETARPFFQGVGRPDLQAVVAGFELATVTASLWPLTSLLGVRGPASAMAIGAGIGAIATIVTLHRAAGFSVRELLMPLLAPCIACVPSVVVSAWLFGRVDTAGALAVELGLFAGVYGGILWLADRLGIYWLEPSIVDMMRRWTQLVLARRDG